MKKLIFTFFLLFTLVCHGQISKMDLTVEFTNIEDSTTYKLYVFSKSDTIIQEKITHNFHKLFDSIKPDVYQVQLYDSKNKKEFSFSKIYVCFPNEITTVNIAFNLEEYIEEINEKSTFPNINDKAEVEYNFFYLQKDWTNQKSIY